MQIFNSCDFKEMPWKNGGGTTTELYRREDQDKNLILRLSMAKVESDGPFSLFPNINRALVVLSGNGFKLTGSSTNTVLKTTSETLYFSGEERINCSLIDGPCLDFNVMTGPEIEGIEVQKIPLGLMITENLETERFYFFPKLNQLIHLMPGQNLTNISNNEEYIAVILTAKTR